jgi:hypothetical protein
MKKYMAMVGLFLLLAFSVAAKGSSDYVTIANFLGWYVTQDTDKTCGLYTYAEKGDMVQGNVDVSILYEPTDPSHYTVWVSGEPDKSVEGDALTGTKKLPLGQRYIVVVGGKLRNGTSLAESLLREWPARVEEVKGKRQLAIDVDKKYLDVVFPYLLSLTFAAVPANGGDVIYVGGVNFQGKSAAIFKLPFDLCIAASRGR